MIVSISIHCRKYFPWYFYTNDRQTKRFFTRVQIVIFTWWFSTSSPPSSTLFHTKKTNFYVPSEILTTTRQPKIRTLFMVDPKSMSPKLRFITARQNYVFGFLFNFSQDLKWSTLAVTVTIARKHVFKSNRTTNSQLQSPPNKFDLRW